MIKTLFWDFDGVLMDSMEVRNEGFRKVLKGYPLSQVDKLMDYHLKNGGLSRYVKFRYFYEEILRESISEKQVNDLAASFSKIMLESLKDTSLLILDAVNFVKCNAQKFNMHIVSGSDGTELNQICLAVDLSKYFKTIHGSPTPKIKLVEELLEAHKYTSSDCLLIGDSINDYEAAKCNNIRFFGYNNSELRDVGDGYIDSFSRIDLFSE